MTDQQQVELHRELTVLLRNWGVSRPTRMVKSSLLGTETETGRRSFPVLRPLSLILTMLALSLVTLRRLILSLERMLVMLRRLTLLQSRRRLLGSPRKRRIELRQRKEDGMRRLTGLLTTGSCLATPPLLEQQLQRDE
jgi:hypothetical protein